MPRGERSEGTGSAADFLPGVVTLPNLRRAAAGCRGCDLYRCATQTVFGEGRRHARLMLVGEQPGDQEDRAGQPFVGPSGRLLDAALVAAGIDRDQVYVTNAVKHFRWEPRAGTKKRIHKTPSARQIKACHPWLQAELAVVQPEVVVALGATAARSLMGNDFRVTRSRGKPIEVDFARALVATVHPSAVLRAPAGERAKAEKEFARDFRAVARLLGITVGRRAELELPIARAVEPEAHARTPHRRTTKPPAARTRTHHRDAR